MKKNLSLQLSFLILSSIACVVALVVMGYLLVRTEKAEVLVVGARLSKTLMPGSKGSEMSFRLAMRLVDSKQFPEIS